MRKQQNCHFYKPYIAFPCFEVSKSKLKAVGVFYTATWGCSSMLLFLICRKCHKLGRIDVKHCKQVKLIGCVKKNKKMFRRLGLSRQSFFFFFFRLQELPRNYVFI